MKKLLILILSVCMIASVFMFSACNGDTDKELSGWDYIKNNGKLVIGLDDTFVPMGFRDESDNLVGFDIDLAKAVCEYLGVEADFRPIDWNSKDAELSGKRIDCIWNGMSATPDRQESMSLTKKYFNNKLIVMALKDSTVTVASAADLANYNIGVQADSAALTALQKNSEFANYSAKIREYDTYDEAILDLQATRVDVIVVDQVLGEYKNTVLGTIMKTCEFDFGPDYYAVGCRKEDPDVAEKINEAIDALIKNGKAAEISQKWFGENLVIFEGYEG